MPEILLTDETPRMTVTETCRRLGPEHGVSISPHELSGIIYRRVLRQELVPMIGGRRMIHPRDLPMIADVIRSRCTITKPTDLPAQAE